MGSSPRTSGTRVMAVPAGEECSVLSAGRKSARCPHRHADQPVNSFQPRGGGGVPDAPTIGAQAPIFQTVSGSGARGKPIQSSGYGLPGIPLADREGSQETVGFLRIFCDFLCVQKVTRRRKDKPILPPFLRRNKPPLRCSPGTAQDPRAEAQPRRGPRRARYSP